MFKNLVLFTFTVESPLHAMDLEDALAKAPLLPCGTFDMQSRGWVHASPAQRYAHHIDGQVMIAYGVDKKILPAGAISDRLSALIKAKADEQGYPVGRRQRREMRSLLIEQLRGQALTQKSITYAWLDLERHTLCVGTGSDTRAEDVLDLLRSTLPPGLLKFQRVEVSRDPIASMTTWLRAGEVPGNFDLEDELELIAPTGDAAKVRYQHSQLDAKAIHEQLAGGMLVTKLGLTWHSRISFVLNDKLQLRKIEFLETRGDSTAGNDASPEEQWEIQFCFVTGELSRLVRDIVDVLNVQDQAAAA